MAGAVTWGNGASGLIGEVGSANSLVGSTANDQVGSGGVTALRVNGNYTVSSPLWNNGSATEAGALTWGDGSAGTTKGAVSSLNSLVGSTSGDHVGSGGVTVLESGNYLVKSVDWNNGGSMVNAGAVTWGKGTTGVAGAVTDLNSIVGTAANAQLDAIFLNATSDTFIVRFLNDGAVPSVDYGFQNPTASVFTSANNTAFTIGAAGSFTFTATGSPIPGFSLISGTLPAGVTYNYITGVLSGTPEAGTAGTYNLTMRATNGLEIDVDQAFTLTIN